MCNSWLIQVRGLKSQFRHALHEEANLQCERCDALVVQYVGTVKCGVSKKEILTGGMAPVEILSSNSRRYPVIMRTGFGSLVLYVRQNSKAE
jgi:hypothetical protein